MGFINLFRKHNTFSHGIHPLEHKESTAGLKIRRLPFAPRMVVPLLQHRGAPAVALVKPGQEVVRGEPIAEPGGFVSVPMHAPVTGRVKAVGELVPTAEGPKTPAIVIDTYEASTQQVLFDSPRDPARLTPEQLVEAVRETGMVGLGGAAFPSHVKLLPPKGKKIDLVVINGCECEPYLTCDHRVMLEQTGKMLAGIRMVMRALGAERAIIGVEDNKLDAVERIRAELPADLDIRCEAVETKYPQGAEKLLITSLTGREVPSGGIPADIGIAVYNVGTMAQLGDLVPRGRGLIERVVTVSGHGVRHPGNYLVPIGTPLRFLLEQVEADVGACEVVLGGPMMGMSTASLDVAITKGVSGVVVFEHREQDGLDRPVFPCIKCSACLDACPLHLNPSMLGQLAGVRDYARMEQEYHLNDCFECGSCSYVCPSNIPLTQYFRIAKAVNRETRETA
ncbi:MAG: electron transport complex subunit RsxC [Candidatus Sedimenticola endophacoides]|uniref:Ion-translocating oxidoreductase complex subunit C n=1 Tax=Candidatus Sedimenticola endophacoides TaxID=2548426 RepID=A0A6N4E451_9GAMM|nr:MAG: electron transport complex subunit RsxC [Candidatus Sedimenticola endophacoides]OQX36679.1 MAG: electron transport complex subunit RsxC [Candidatus Sedimenticola endophacoides]OQX41678.1 MAG: electron transport complex subunit RsxC [Candidatus Sedimenticola endophacoides]PUE00370.1 MAG: electron transport complex subunit RsxC [Candidatus Sedimenticola endophacoides]PUE03888.1 MAG: electron transport complex subunit RsxC [Candidatus Sedimenticola endophacoides]